MWKAFVVAQSAPEIHVLSRSSKLLSKYTHSQPGRECHHCRAAGRLCVIPQYTGTPPSSLVSRMSYTGNCKNWLIKTKPNIFNITNQLWLTVHLTTTTWSIGQRLQFWTQNRTKILDGSKKRYVFGKRDKVLWTGTRAAIYTLSHTYDRFLATSHHYRGKNRKRK